LVIINQDFEMETILFSNPFFMENILIIVKRKTLSARNNGKY